MDLANAHAAAISHCGGKATELRKLKDSYAFLRQCEKKGSAKLPVDSFLAKKHLGSLPQELVKSLGFVLHGSTWTLDHSDPGAVQFLDQATAELESVIRDAANAERKLCVRECGFFGDAETNGMCSKCFQIVQKEILEKASKGLVNEVKVSTWKPKFKRAHFKCKAMYLLRFAKRIRIEKSRTQCWTCGKRVGLVLAAVTCKCSHTFCEKHRYPKDHDCSFNFRDSQRRILKQTNPEVHGTKVDKI